MPRPCLLTLPISLLQANYHYSVQADSCHVLDPASCEELSAERARGACVQEEEEEEEEEEMEDAHEHEQ